MTRIGRPQRAGTVCTTQIAIPSESPSSAAVCRRLRQARQDMASVHQNNRHREDQQVGFVSKLAHRVSWVPYQAPSRSREHAVIPAASCSGPMGPAVLHRGTTSSPVFP